MSEIEKDITPIGIGRSVRISQPIANKYNKSKLEYKVLLELTPEEAEPLKSKIDRKLSGLKMIKGEDWEVKKPYYIDEKNNNVVFVIKTSATFKDNETGEDIHKKIAIVDAYNRPISDNVIVGNGSTLRCRIGIGEWTNPSKKLGISLYLNSVQVKNLVEYDMAGFEPLEELSNDTEEYQDEQTQDINEQFAQAAEDDRQ
jgi:hypothetical protein